MADDFLVTRAKGPAGDHVRLRREQDGWDEHAAFMDRLVEEGFVVLGGPVGEGDGEEIRARLAPDPWGEDMLATASVRPWAIFLRRP